MIGVDEALATILAAVTALPPEMLALDEAHGRCLAEDVTAPHDVPPYRNAAMDGFAVRGADLAGIGGGAATLAVVANIAAGHPSDVTIGPGQAARIMTGAQMPAGADTVVRFEETEKGAEPTQVRIARAVRLGENVRQAGEDVAAGGVVFGAGTPLGAAHLGVLASLGHGRVRVHGRPRVAVVSTGDEVVAVDAPLGAGQLRDSNSYTLAALVAAHGGQPVRLGIARDRLDELRQLLAQATNFDLVISSGGVSAGDYDVVKDALRAEGRIDLWQVNMKPGRPLAFGRLRGVPYLGLPGNPVAAMVSYWLFGRPLIRRLAGHRDLEPDLVRATADEALENGSARRHFVRVHLRRTPEGGYRCRLAGDQGAGVLMSMARANGLAIVPEGAKAIEPGEPVEVIALGWPASS